MTAINHRNFPDKSIKVVAGMASSSLANGFLGNDQPQIGAVIPMPIQVVIDDVGWWSGEDGHARQEPYRTGIQRGHVPADYLAIVNLGKALGIRPQAAMILCEWDTQNILRDLPTSTWMGEKWDNKKWVGPWLEQAADIITANRKHFELTLHGVGHEFWMNGEFTRAEWANTDGIMRPLDQVEAHLDFYTRLLDQHNLGPLPTAFVPTAFLHSFGPTSGHEVSMAHVLKKRGIYYINTPYEDMRNAGSVENRFYGIDDGVMTVDRGRDLLSWKSIGMLPQGELKRPTCGLHWPNLLHQDPSRNMEIVEGWVHFLKPYNLGRETMLSSDSDDFLNQLVHYEGTTSVTEGKRIKLNFSALNIPEHADIGIKFYMKVSSPAPLNFSPTGTEIAAAVIEKQTPDFQYRLDLRRIPDVLEAVVECSIKT